MTDFIAGLSGPDVFPHKLDLVQDRVLLIRLDERDYRAASFLDDRVLTASTQGAWAPYAPVERAASSLTSATPLHFIFHGGHVGSTLLSRLLDQAGSVLGLREPLPLRTLAEAQDVLGTPSSLLSETEFDSRIETFLRLWSRPFAGTSTAIVKATSSTARLAPRLLERRLAARAVCLNLRAEPYLATLLAGANAVFDLRALGQERVRRLLTFSEVPSLALHALSPGELAAMSWLTETLTQRSLAQQFGSRVRTIDFEAMLSDTENTIAAVAAHFEIAAAPDFAARAASSPILARYSKAPEQFAYSADLRRQVLSEARQTHRSEIAAGLRFLERLAKLDTRIAEVI